MRYFVCTIGAFGERSEPIKVLGECLSQKVYKLHRDARWPAPLGQIQAHDTVLLKLWNQIVAYGLAKGPVHVEPEDYNDGWNRIVDIECWTPFNPESPTSGVHHYGIQEATVAGAGQFATVKEVTAPWAVGKIAAFAGGANLVTGVAWGGGEDTDVTCQNSVSLEDIFRRPLHIPPYQRCFCWRKRNVTDLLETLRFRDRVDDIHLGTIILKQNENKLHIVDGQQRLLTLTILAFCIGCKDSPLLKASFNGTSNDAESAQKHLYWAKKTVDTWLKINDAWLKTNDASGIGPLLKKIQFTVITLSASALEDLAYHFFDAVNSSGVKMSDYDLLKAHHLRFITDEPVAKAMADRWDFYGADGYDDVLHKTLYRLRNWSRYSNPVVDAQEGHKLFTHFSAKAPAINGIFFPPLTVRFNSSIQGGAMFFHYVEQHRMLWEEFREMKACLSLDTYLSGHSGNVLRDMIRALLFAFYCRFGGVYLDDALYYIADVISVLRNGLRVGGTTFRADVIKDCLFSLETALEPGQFFDWCVSPERQYSPEKNGATKNRYWEALGRLYAEIQKRHPATEKQIKQREDIINSQPTAARA